VEFNPAAALAVVPCADRHALCLALVVLCVGCPALFPAMAALPCAQCPAMAVLLKVKTMERCMYMLKHCLPYALRTADARSRPDCCVLGQQHLYCSVQRFVIHYI